jgi:metal-responsive CopG/Arc/MetJ family transcriptional regulator
MKTAVSVPDAIFKKAERLARRLRKSRSQLYSEAVAEYVRRHDPDAITTQMNQVCEALESMPDLFVASASRRILERIEW